MTESFMTWEHGDTWYRIVGDLTADPTPVIVLHGGPGASHDYCEPIAEMLAAQGRAAVLYDQIGCGKSSHLPDKPADFWTVQLFLDELNLLAEHLGLAGRHSIVGQSWGGMLGMEYAITQPAGLKSLVVADSPASMVLWAQETGRLRAALPEDVQATLTKHETEGTVDDPEYAAATKAFYDLHLCRVPWPDCVTRSFAQLDEDPTVYRTMNGPSEFTIVGSLKTWDITDQLHAISVPTLLISGRYDEATPLIVGTIHERIPNSQWVLFEESSHMPHIEEPEAFIAALEGFLEDCDAS